MKDSNLVGGVAVIERDGKHLLIKQSGNKPFGGQWRHPGGKFESHESPIKGLKREIREEVGLEIEVTRKEPLMVMKSDYEYGNFGFFEARVRGGELRTDKREIEDAGWFTKEDAKRMNLMNATRNFYENP